MTAHELKDGALHVARRPDGLGLGVVAECTCGWTSGPRFSRMLAQVFFDAHCEEMRAVKRTSQGDNDA